MQLPFHWDVVVSAVCNSEETVVSRQEHWKEGTKYRECRCKGNSVFPFLPCPLLLFFPTVNSLLLRPFSPLTITYTYLLLPVRIRMKKNLRNMCSLFQGLHPWRNWLPHPNTNSSELPRAYQSGMRNASPALLRFRLAWSCADGMHAVSDVVSACVRWPSHAHQRSLTFFSAVLFFFSFFQTFLLTLPSPSDHAPLSFRIYSQLFRVRPIVGKNRFGWKQFHCYAYEKENQSPLV